MMKIALGMMIRNFISPHPIDTFLDNAAKYGHDITNVIVVYSGEFNEDAKKEIETKYGVKFTAHKINEAKSARDELTKMGVSEKSVAKLLYTDILSRQGLVPYGFNRNNVMIAALLEEVDVLFYIDDDVAPYVLRKKTSTSDREKEIYEQEIDFFGRHLEQIEAGARYTTSDYSGYNILPYAHFDGMEELLVGLQKDSMLEFWLHAREHKCMYLQQNDPPVPRRTKKVLGGNLAIDLRSRADLLPFFSPTYELDGTVYLARGEDTLIANLAEEAQLKCIDVDMYIFHNTYGDFPEIPSLKDKAKTQERFFYACTGWIGRNPFMNYLLGNSLERMRARQERNLIYGAQALIAYTGNDMFGLLPRAHSAAWDSLPSMVLDYEDTMDAWSEFIHKIIL
ncbi:MAG: hypothetical protein IJ132_02595 [Firmicutes bacterium]|nr:hypothetical protein [Bacillota bacterium]